MHNYVSLHRAHTVYFLTHPIILLGSVIVSKSSLRAPPCQPRPMNPAHSKHLIDTLFIDTTPFESIRY